MKITMLWGQRTCLYDGEFFPELIDSVDENTYDENPDYLNSKYKAMCGKIGDGWDSIRILQTEIDDEDIFDAMGTPKVTSHQLEVV